MTKVLYAMIMPLYDNGNFKGALVLLFCGFYPKMVDRAELTKRFQTRLITVVDRNNRIISTSDPISTEESLAKFP